MKEKLLRCTNKNCESHETDEHSFYTYVNVYDDGAIAENPKKIMGTEYTCNECDSQAEWRTIN